MRSAVSETFFLIAALLDGEVTILYTVVKKFQFGTVELPIATVGLEISPSLEALRSKLFKLNDQNFSVAITKPHPAASAVGSEGAGCPPEGGGERPLGGCAPQCYEHLVLPSLMWKGEQTACSPIPHCFIWQSGSFTIGFGSEAAHFRICSSSKRAAGNALVFASSALMSSAA